MKTIINVMALAFVALGLTACALLAPLQADGKARYAGKLLLTGYETTQQAMLIYGNLKPCDPDPRSVFDRLCRDVALWAKIKAADRGAVAAIVAATPVLNGERADAGELVKAIAAVATVKAAVDEALAQIKGPKVPAGST